jgi:hypothetical protein
LGSSVRLAALLLGLLIGAVTGYVTRPMAAEIKIGQVSVEFSDNQVSAGSAGGLSGGQIRHIFIFALVGGVAGALAGVLIDRRR